jgi:hypothetical protein
MGSGDFHHLSWPLIDAASPKGFSAKHPLRVVVLDNHPDNMRFPWGVHCGSWVRRVAMHPAVSQVHVAGITSQDIGRATPGRTICGRCARQAHLLELRRGHRLGQAPGRGQGVSQLCRYRRAGTGAVRHLHDWPQDTYLSIDKDVFAAEVVRTNWDQGRMLEEQAVQLIDALRGQIAGSDITGDVSSWHYGTWWKRLMSAGDGQDTQIDAATLAGWQAGMH